MENTCAVKYVGLIMPQDSVKRGESLNAMVMLENTSDKPVSRSVKLFIQDGGEWRICAVRDYDIPPREHLHAYLSIPGEFFKGGEADEFLIFAGEAPPQSDVQLRGLSALVNVVV